MAHLSQSTVFKSDFAATQRRDAWWLPPISVILSLVGFAIYTTWAALQGQHYQFGPYLSPFYSPLLLLDWWPWSPAILILWSPLGFRTTCYYFRKAYYRSFFADPPACAVGEWRKLKYTGETKWPFILQNLHRYFLFLDIILVVFLWTDVAHAFWFDGRVGMGVGSLVLLLDTVLLSLYTFSCHSFRHLLGGRSNCFSCTASRKIKYTLWKSITSINERHMFWGWISLFVVGLTDLYVRLCSMGVIKDFRFF